MSLFDSKLEDDNYDNNDDSGTAISYVFSTNLIWIVLLTIVPENLSSDVIADN